MTNQGLIQACIDTHIALVDQIDVAIIQDIAVHVKDCFKQGGTLILFGNGGSAADAEHIAAEFVGRFVKDRRALPALALSENTASVTAIGNDYGYDQVFRRQLEAFVRPNDVVIGLSTSGHSANVVQALSYAKQQSIRTIGLTGNRGGAVHDIVDIGLRIPSSITARIQEMHLMVGHIICECVDAHY